MPQIAQIIVNTRPLDTLIAVVPKRAHDILDKTAFDVEAVAKPLAAVDTGAMRSSVYVSGASGGSQYGQAITQAQALRPGVNVFDEVAPDGKFERIVGVAVEYAYWQELVNPYLSPAVEQVRPDFVKAWSQLV